MTQERMKCPFCSELILRDAIKCRFCREWLVKEQEGIRTEGPREDFRPLWRSQVKEADEDQAAEQELAGEGSLARVGNVDFWTQGHESGSAKKRCRIPWLRIILVMAYLGIVAALVISEFNAHRILRDAQANENAQNYRAAFSMYQDITEAFPFSFAIIGAQQHLSRLCDPNDSEMPKPSWRLAAENMLGTELNAYNIYPLPSVTWPACAVLLFLVLLSRIRRYGVALLVLLLMIVAIAGVVVQFSWYGLTSFEPMTDVVQELMRAPLAVYCASYVLLILTAMMTLTATSKHKSRRKNKTATAKER